ncbi:MAG: DEAD/DEAH box helicase [Nitrospinaceae bacterium]
MTLRPYQSDLIINVRHEIARHANVMMQLPTAGGKTRIFSEMTRLATDKKNKVWIMVPRNELLRQSSRQLSALGIHHGMISAKSRESRAFNVHVVSKDTLLRRIKAGKIKRWPKLIIVDEAHLSIDQQLFIRQNAPPETRFIGVTATPERLDGRGLNELYGAIVYGPTIKDLIELHFLSQMKYFRIPGWDGSALAGKDFTGTDVKADVLDSIMKARHIYGNAITHYRREANGKPCIVFCRSVKIAEETAQRFRNAGYRFESIDGKMSDKTREALIDGIREGRLQGLTSCELITYGLDVPRVECIIMLRPTLSRTLFYQMIGRGLRPSPGKRACVILDHVGNFQEFGHPLWEYNWKFDGVEKRKRNKEDDQTSLKLCEKCFMYFEETICPNCGTERSGKSQQEEMEVDGNLVEVSHPVKMYDRPPEKRQELQDKIGELIEQARQSLSPGPIGELLQIAADLGNKPIWVYWLLSGGMKAINVPLLSEIRRQKEFKPGWFYHQKKKIESRLGRTA